jgi:two-component system cell cycle sensor histidine kinase/response regulator CckA
MTTPPQEAGRLAMENRRLAEERDLLMRYIRAKTDELLVLLKCPTMNADALSDMDLIGYDPIGTIAISFAHVLENLNETNRRLQAEMENRKMYEEEHLKAQKLESIGVLAGGIAHDFNNLLTGILGNISMAGIHPSSSVEFEESLGRAEKACLRARELTRQLLIFSEGGAPVRKTMAIGPVLLKSAERFLGRENVRFEIDLPEDLAPVEIDEPQIVQVFNNIVANAEQAMPGGGTVRFSAENVTVADRDPLPLAAGPFVRVSIVDTGVGIPQGALLKVFDPFYTTKTGGSGLGLSTAYSVLRQHGGLVTVESEKGKGTTFRIYLPASSAAATGKAAHPRPPQEKGRVLVMDDEAMVREVAVEFLVHLGYEAMAVEAGEDAMEAYRAAKSSGRPFAAVIMDLTIPGRMGGKEAVRRLLDFDPLARTIVSSGYSNDPVMADYRSHGFQGVIAKPYRIGELREVLETVLEQASAS